MKASSDHLLVFAVSGRRLAVSTAAIAEIVLEPALVRLPDMPPVLAGVFSLRGWVVPVVRAEVLLGLPPPCPGPFRAVLVLGDQTARWALLAERALAVITAPALAPVPADSSFDDCVAAAPLVDGAPLPVLSPERLLRRREAEALVAFAARAARRGREFGLDLGPG